MEARIFSRFTSASARKNHPALTGRHFGRVKTQAPKSPSVPAILPMVGFNGARNLQ
jgi:hypothetical protein